ncbi:hypothetical protein [Sphaerisporangium sp. NPDC051011]|uniref:hypothetical protein n=1 Tax=Sphaerisporangium sp. NPDC051011 TaxID=3155792 RepID=UPI0033DD0999
MIKQMVERIDLYREGGLSLPKLVADLRGLFDASGLRGWAESDAFYDLWVDLDSESDIRTETWAPPDSADDARLAAALDGLRAWATTTASKDVPQG